VAKAGRRRREEVANKWSRRSHYVAKGIGKVMHDALVRLGIPGPLATMVAMAFDPLHASENPARRSTTVGTELGVPRSSSTS
jgi:hypothetical protein